MHSITISNVDRAKFVSFFNMHSYTILKTLYKQEKTENILPIKANILRENINKNDSNLLSQIKKLDKDRKYSKYYKSLLSLLLYQNIDEASFQKGLEKINEKSSIRKQNGVYYTPDDVSSFIFYNSLNLLIKTNNVGVINNKNEYIFDNKFKQNILNRSVFDPTCGTGAFLIKAFDSKLSLIRKENNKVSSSDVLDIVSSLYGNDIDNFSTYITQTRLLFKSINICPSIDLKKLLNILKRNFFNYNMLDNSFSVNKKFDLIIGNPPYVEKSKVEDVKIIKYGNIFADVIENSFKFLKDSGVIGFIIPISYVSTPRFSKFRDFIKNNTSNQYILNYADRPDCLFSGVHQKLNILIAQKLNSQMHNIYTSDYAYWYKSERETLFNNISFVKNDYLTDSFYPKLCSLNEINIYKKVIQHKNNICSYITGDNCLYLNMRAAFWIKSFITPPYKSKEYKELFFSSDVVHLINIILNSSLFWWFWIKVSDCWHITSKELKLFSIPSLENIDLEKAKHLSLKLNFELEKTKEKVNTKQTLYEYKHKRCKDTIDEIDDFLSIIYGLTVSELNYIKSYKEDYRLGINKNE